MIDQWCEIVFKVFTERNTTDDLFRFHCMGKRGMLQEVAVEIQAYSVAESRLTVAVFIIRHFQVIMQFFLMVKIR